MSYITPTYGGDAIFGHPVMMTTDEPPNEIQMNAFPGINGVEVLDLGSRVRHTHVRSRYVADSMEGIGALFGILRNYKRNPQAFPLYTTAGETFPLVKLQSFRPIPPIHADGSTASYYQDFEATLIHLL